ncbi:MAG: hypothetical protein ACQEVT_09200 [Pseudomonadota bacterium]|uniref:hypothetical protein n=1 Tax=Roseovarius sp. TaxID=1486281 RepID=UPI003566891D
MTYATKTPAFRIAALALAGTLIASAIPASAMEINPSDRAPTWVSESDFSAMNANEIYEIDRAQRLGASVIIEGHSASQSREVVDAALAETPVTRTVSSFDATGYSDPQDTSLGSHGR